jgi:hypothetical protein
MPKMTPAQVDELVAWAEKGKSGQWIAKKMDLKPSAVCYRMLRNGYDPWPGEPKHPRKDHPGAFTAAEDAQLLALGKTLSIGRIAQKLRRPPTSCRIRLLTLEVRAEKKLEKAST